MLNICIFVPSLKKGGAEKQFLLLAQILKNDYNLLILSFYNKEIDKQYLNFINENKLNLLRLRGTFLKKVYLFYMILRTNRIHIIFTFLATGNILSSIIGRLARTPHIIGGIRSSHFSTFKLVLQRYCHNYLMQYTVINNYCGMEILIKNGYEKNKLLVIPNCIETKNLPITRMFTRSISILSVGRFVHEKDYYTALKSIEYLNKIILSEEYEIKYYIVGYGELYSKILNLIEVMHLNKIVQVVVNPGNVNYYYETSDIFLSTSLFEGLANAIMEAMTFSLPVVATDVGDNKHLIIKDFNGYLEETRDYIAIAASLKRLVLNIELRNRLGRNSYNHIIENYHMDRFQSQYHKLLFTIEN